MRLTRKTGRQTEVQQDANIGDGPTPMQQAITIEKAELNVADINAERFAMPAVEEPAAAE